MTVCEWVELDVWGRTTGKAFTGTVEGLSAHLLIDLPAGGIVRPPIVQRMHLNRVDQHLAELVTTSVVWLVTPWGHYGWIPRPRPRRRRA